MALFKKVSFKLKELEERFIQSKLLIIILPVALILILILYSAPLILNNSQLKEEIEMEFAQQLNADLKINGEVKTSLFPSPNITFNNFYLRGLFTGSKTINLHVDKAKVNLSILSVIFSKFDIKDIEATNVNIEIINSTEKQDNAKSKSLKKIISQSQLNKVKQKGIAGNLFSIESMLLKNENFFGKIDFKVNNLNLTYFSKLENKKELKNISINTKIKKNNISAEGFFFTQDTRNNFNINLFASITNKKSAINIKSENYDFLASGKFFPSKNEKPEDFFSNFNGDISMSIFNLKSFLKSFFSKNSNLYKKISDDSNSINLSSKVKKEGRQIEITNCEISSEVVNGVADFYIGYDSEVPILDSQLDIDFIDFDKIIVEKKLQQKTRVTYNSQEENTPKQKEGDLNLEQSISSQDMRDIDLNLEVKINKAKYLLEEVRDISIYSSISKNGEILILPLKFKTPGNGDFRITGILDNRNNNSKFLGKVDAKGENLSILLNWLGINMDNLKTNDLNGFTIYSDIFLKPSSTHFDNLYLNIINGPEILGESNFYYHSNPYNISKFNILNLEIDKFMQTSAKNTYLSPGSLLKKTLWLVNIDMRSDIELKINELKTKNSTFNSNNFKIRIGRGYFEIDKMKLEATNKESEEDLTTSLAIQIKEPISSLNIAIESENLSLKRSSSDLDVSIVDRSQSSLTDLYFSLPSIENFNGKISADLKNFRYGENILKSTKIKGNIDNGIIKFTQFRTLFNDGRINFSGSTAIKFDKSISGNLSLVNFPVKTLVSNTFNIDSLDGITNLSSSISSYGSKHNEFISNLNLKAKYNAVNVVVKNFGLSTLIQKMFNIKKYHQELDKSEDILKSEVEKTLIKKASGTLSINNKKDDIFVSKFSGTAFNGIINSNFSTVAKTGSGQSKIVFLTGNKKRQIPINITSSIQGAIDSLSFNYNLKQADSYISRAKKFYANPRNKNRNLLKKEVKKENKKDKNNKQNPNLNQNQQQQVPVTNPRANIDPALMDQIMRGNYPIPKDMQQQINKMQPRR